MAAKERIDRKTKTITAWGMNSIPRKSLASFPVVDVYVPDNRDRKIAIPRCWIPHVNA
jgi:hypothetical protein